MKFSFPLFANEAIAEEAFVLPFANEVLEGPEGARTPVNWVQLAPFGKFENKAGTDRKSVV